MPSMQSLHAGFCSGGSQKRPPNNFKETTVNIEILTAAGFVHCEHPSIGEGSLIKKLKAWDMPYVREHMIGENGLTDSDTVYVEVQPQGVVTMGIEVTGYHEEPVPTDSEDGLGILRDAGVAV